MTRHEMCQFVENWHIVVLFMGSQIAHIFIFHENQWKQLNFQFFFFFYWWHNSTYCLYNILHICLEYLVCQSLRSVFPRPNFVEILTILSNFTKISTYKPIWVENFDNKKSCKKIVLFHFCTCFFINLKHFISWKNGFNFLGLIWPLPKLLLLLLNMDV